MNRQNRALIRAAHLPSVRFPALLTALLGLAGCAPEVGSEAWCEALAEKSKGDWSINEATEFATSCLFKTYDED